jgi:bifunctional oligoribonuclease and PAP phosphatase NrnA
MSATLYSAINDQLRAAQRIGIVCHVRPDGDALGSLLGLGLSLKLAGKEVILLSHDGVPWNLEFLPQSKLIRQPDGGVLEIDLAVALDTASRDRMGEACITALSGAQLLINIDHHGSNPGYGDINLIDPTAPAVGQIIFDLLSAGAWPMDDEVRQALFVAISTDTGSFQYSSTTAHTHEVVAAMIQEGLDTAALAQLLYARNPMRKMELLRALLNEMELSADGRIASWRYSQATKLRIGVKPGDTEGLIDHLRGIEGVICAVIAEEQKDGRIRISARSQDPAVDVAKVCAHFGGGGHRLAAGATLPGPLNEAAAAYLSQLQNELR